MIVTGAAQTLTRTMRTSAKAALRKKTAEAPEREEDARCRRAFGSAAQEKLRTHLGQPITWSVDTCNEKWNAMSITGRIWGKMMGPPLHQICEPLRTAPANFAVT